MQSSPKLLASSEVLTAVFLKIKVFYDTGAQYGRFGRLTSSGKYKTPMKREPTNSFETSVFTN
jgi:hypothetical protein